VPTIRCRTAAADQSDAVPDHWFPQITGLRQQAFERVIEFMRKDRAPVAGWASGDPVGEPPVPGQPSRRRSPTTAP
jgi:hypothetical protein